MVWVLDDRVPWKVWCLKEGRVTTIYTRWRGYQAPVLCPATSVVWKAKSVATLRYHTHTHQVTTLPETPVLSQLSTYLDVWFFTILVLNSDTTTFFSGSCWIWICCQIIILVSFQLPKLCCSEKCLRGLKKVFQEMMISKGAMGCALVFWRNHFDKDRAGYYGSWQEYHMRG